MNGKPNENISQTRVKCLCLRLNRLVWDGKWAGMRPMSPKNYFWEPQNGLQRQVMGGKSPQRPRKLNMTSWTTTQMGNPSSNPSLSRRSFLKTLGLAAPALRLSRPGRLKRRRAGDCVTPVSARAGWRGRSHADFLLQKCRDRRDLRRGPEPHRQGAETVSEGKSIRTGASCLTGKGRTWIPSTFPRPTTCTLPSRLAPCNSASTFTARSRWPTTSTKCGG